MEKLSLCGCSDDCGKTGFELDARDDGIDVTVMENGFWALVGGLGSPIGADVGVTVTFGVIVFFLLCSG